MLYPTHNPYSHMAKPLKPEIALPQVVVAYLYGQACKLKFRFRELTSCSYSAAVCFEGPVAGLDTTETGNELSQPNFEFTALLMAQKLHTCQILQ